MDRTDSLSTGCMQGQRVLAFSVSSQTSSTSAESALTCPPQRLSLRFRKSSPCHKVSDKVKGFEAKASTTLVAEAATVEVALKADKATITLVVILADALGARCRDLDLDLEATPSLMLSGTGTCSG